MTKLDYFYEETTVELNFTPVLNFFNKREVIDELLSNFDSNDKATWNYPNATLEVECRYNTFPWTEEERDGEPAEASFEVIYENATVFAEIHLSYAKDNDFLRDIWIDNIEMNCDGFDCKIE